jgi:hypothetical protein
MAYSGGFLGRSEGGRRAAYAAPRRRSFPGSAQPGRDGVRVASLGEAQLEHKLTEDPRTLPLHLLILVGLAFAVVGVRPF